jgi:hypothetical protein
LYGSIGGQVAVGATSCTFGEPCGGVIEQASRDGAHISSTTQPILLGPGVARGLWIAAKN